MNSASSSKQHRRDAPGVIRFSVLTVSDTRTIETDGSGLQLVDSLVAAGHTLVDRQIVADEPVEIQKAVRGWIGDGVTEAILVTGGTGLARRDQTPEAIVPLFDVELPGFGELFRMLSFEEIGPAAMLSRATAGRIGNVLVFLLPGSTAAIRLAVDRLLIPELPHMIHITRG